MSVPSRLPRVLFGATGKQTNQSANDHPPHHTPTTTLDESNLEVVESPESSDMMLSTPNVPSCPSNIPGQFPVTPVSSLTSNRGQGDHLNPDSFSHCQSYMDQSTSEMFPLTPVKGSFNNSSAMIQDQSSPYGLNGFQDTTCSSPTFLRSRVNELRLFTSPQTPKTLYQRAARFRTQSLNQTNRTAEGNATRCSSVSFAGTTTSRGIKRSRLTPRGANINPFTPNGIILEQERRVKRRKSWNLDQSGRERESTTNRESSSEGSDQMSHNDLDQDMNLNSDDFAIHEKQLGSGGQVPVSSEDDPFLTSTSTCDGLDSRYILDFHEICRIGSGSFGSVFKCINRLDGCVYAVKQSLKPVKGSRAEKRALNEVWAHAVLGKHRRVVHYYTAWAEEERMYIQNEFCEGGSLAQVIESLRRSEQRLPEPAIRRILLHVSQGLKYIHSHGLAHMDIKPENIFLTKKLDMNNMNNSNLGNLTLEESSYLHDDGFFGADDDEYDDAELTKENVNFKIGDFGLVTPSSQREPEEGDCRYLAPELLRDDVDHKLNKCDIFSLGLTIIEIIRSKELPKNGTEWHDLRSGQIPDYAGISIDLMNLIRKMVSLNPEERPTADQIISSPVIVPFSEKSRAQLRRELNSSRLLIDELTRENQQLKEKSAQKKKKSTKSNLRRSLSLNFDTGEA